MVCFDEVFKHSGGSVSEVITIAIMCCSMGNGQSMVVTKAEESTAKLGRKFVGWQLVAKISIFARLRLLRSGVAPPKAY